MNTRWLAYSSALLALMAFGYACKGGDGGGEDGVITVLITSPEDGRTDVPVETRVGFQIDAAIDPTTLTNETFFVADSDGTRIPATVEVGDAPDVAVMIPDEPLSVVTTFTATITTDLTSSAGDTLTEDFEWSFTTLDSEWGTSEFIEETGTGISSAQQIAVDGQSNALAVWEYLQESGDSVWANRYTRTGLWGEPERIDAGTGDATDPQVAADGAGNGFAVWRVSETGVTGNIWGSRYTVDEGWGTPEILQTELTTARNPSIAADSEGNAVAVWIQRDMDTPNEVVWSSRWSGGTWVAEPIDDTPSPLGGRTTAVGMDASGNAIAMWTRPAVPGDVIWANRHTPIGGWGTAELVESDGTTDVTNARLSVGAGGDAFVIWGQDEGTRRDVWAVRFSGAWGAPERVDAHNSGDTIEPDIAVDGTGIAHAVWSQTDLAFRNIWANQYTPGAGWGTPELIEPPNPEPGEDGDATTPRVGVNSVGNAFVVWRQTFDDWGSIWSNRLDPGDAWDPATTELIEDIPRAASNPEIVVDENRHAHALWLHSVDSGITWVRTNRFE